MVEVRFLQDARNRREAVTWDRKQSQIKSPGAARDHLVAQDYPQGKPDSQRGCQTAL